MVGVRDAIAVLVVTTFCLTLFAVGAVGAQDNETAGDDIEDLDEFDELDDLEIDADTECLTGDGSSFTVGSDDGTHIWIRMHVAALTDSGGSFGVELTGSTEDERIIEVVVGLNHVGDGFLDTLTSPASSYDLVGGFDFELSIFDDVSPDIDNGETPGFDDEDDESDGESAAESDGEEPEGEAERDREDAEDSPFELLDC